MVISMAFMHGAIDQQASPYAPQSSNYSHFAEEDLRASYVRCDFGSGRKFFRNQRNAREAIQIELQKERIREEIIAGEIARLRVREAKERREMASRRGEGFSFRLPPPPPPYPAAIRESGPVTPIEERIALSAARHRPMIYAANSFPTAIPGTNFSGTKRRAFTPLEFIPREQTLAGALIRRTKKHRHWHSNHEYQNYW